MANESSTEEDIWESVPNTYMTRRYVQSAHVWIYRLDLRCQAPISPEMLMYASSSDAEQKAYRKMLNEMMSLCQNELRKIT